MREYRDQDGAAARPFESIEHDFKLWQRDLAHSHREQKLDKASLGPPKSSDQHSEEANHSDRSERMDDDGVIPDQIANNDVDAVEVDAQSPIEADDAQDEVQPVDEQPDEGEVVPEDEDDQSQDQTEGQWPENEIDEDVEVDELLAEMQDDDDTLR